MRLINADALKYAIPPTHVDTFENCRNCTLLTDEDVERLIDGTPTAVEWISVDDRLPPDDQMVIGYTPVDGYMFIGFHKTYRYSWSEAPVNYWYIITSMRSTKRMTKKVTHWMPLPEPPKEVKQNG